MADVIERATDEAEIAPQAAASNGHGDAGSLMASLRAKRDEIEAVQALPLELEIPGYDGLLLARYKRTDWEIVSDISDRINASDDPRADVLGAADLLIACCEEMITPKDGEYVSLHQAPGLEQSVKDALEDKPVRLETRLARAFGYPAETARDAVFGLFRNEFAVIDQHRDVMRWLWTTKRKADEDF